MKKIDFNSSYLYAGTVISPNKLFLLLRRNFQSTKAHCVAIIADGNSIKEITIDNDFYVDVVFYKEHTYLIGKNGNTIRFNIPKDATTSNIEESRKDFKINDTDSFLELIKVTLINKEIYCCGQFGQIYLRQAENWVRADHGFRSKESPDIEDICGFSNHELYTFGDLDGSINWFNGKVWKKTDIHTEEIINSATVGKDYVYAVGDNGLVIRGRRNQWQTIGKSIEEKTYWDVLEHNDICYMLHEEGIDYIDNSNVIKPAKVEGKLRADTGGVFTSGSGQFWVICQDAIYLFEKGSFTRKELI